ncbi:MAG: PhoH family protein [Bacteroides sp.]
MGTKKNFVLDTNVILHDYTCLKSFQENDIYLPIVVLEELDKFKKGNEQINYNAREFVRELDLITDGIKSLKEGVSLGEGMGKLYIITEGVESPAVKKAFMERKPDHEILATADWIIKVRCPGEKTILVTKDVNLRMKARSIGVPCEDYITDKVVDIDAFEKTNEVFDGIASEIVDRIYSSKDGIDIGEFDFKDIVQPNECFVLKSDRASVLARYNPFTHCVQRINKSKNYGIEPRNAEQSFAFEILNDPDIKLVALTGKAGTGKTLLALAAALGKLTDYKQILLARPIVALSNKDLGFLPGDATAKVAPYMQPLFDNLNVIKRQFAGSSAEVKRIEEMQKSEQLVIEALAFIRGRSLSETYCIIDEAQNLTPHEIKTIITRAGEGTKMVFTGDIQQIDQPYLDSQSNGLVYMIDKMKGQNIFAHVNLLKGERSKLSELASNIL